MVAYQTMDVANQAKAIYEGRLRAELEQSDPNRFVAIEPISGAHFLADTFSAAVQAAQAAYPGRIAFVIRIGHQAALHLGGLA